jgi:hypothetical protein
VCHARPLLFLTSASGSDVARGLLLLHRLWLLWMLAETADASRKPSEGAVYVLDCHGFDK